MLKDGVPVVQYQLPSGGRATRAVSFVDNENGEWLHTARRQREIQPTLDELASIARKLLGGPFLRGDAFNAARQKLPHGKPGVYVVRKPSGKVVYVGMSRGLRARLGQYVPVGRGLGGGRFRIIVAKMRGRPVKDPGLTKWMLRNLEWSFHAVDTADQANMVEMFLIRHLRHKQMYNKA